MLFLVLFLVIATIAWKRTAYKDGFQDTPAGASPGLVVPVISPRGQTLTRGEVKPFTEPSTALLAPPPGQAASINSLPAEDPALQKVDARRLYSIYESLIGFFKNEAEGLRNLGDASITLPLSTAKGDVGRLRDELSALDRNPGLESALTQDDANGIEANLAYLQKKWRLSANSMSAPSPMKPAEGFTSRQGGGWFSYFFGGEQEGFQPVGSGSDSGTTSGMGMGAGTASGMGMGAGTASGMGMGAGTGMGMGMGAGTASGMGAGTASGMGAGTASGMGAGTASGMGAGTGMGTGTGTMSGTGTGTTTTGCSGSSCKAGLEDLTNLSTQIVAEVVRLQASGAQDSTTQNRIKLLSSILQTVNDLTSGLKNGTIKPTDISLTMGQVTSFLTNIKNPNSPLTAMLSDWGLPSGLSNLFPTYASGDVSGADLAKDLFGKYIKDVKNLSWDISLSHKGQAEQEIAAHYASAMKDARYFADTAGTPTASNADNSAPTDSGKASAYRGLFDSVINSVTGQKPETLNVSMGATKPGAGAAGHAAGGNEAFNWKERSKQICSQIKMREMDPYEFGCLKDTETVRQDNFSWRGYTKMVCTRLSTVYDPSIPELCGCPPPSWIGWRP